MRKELNKKTMWLCLIAIHEFLVVDEERLQKTKIDSEQIIITNRIQKYIDAFEEIVCKGEFPHKEVGEAFGYALILCFQQNIKLGVHILKSLPYALKIKEENTYDKTKKIIN